MKYSSLKNRIASAYILSTAILVGVIFLALYVGVSISVLNQLDEDLSQEVSRHSDALTVKDGVIALKNHEEWMEREHNTIGVDPVFIEFVDSQGEIIDKSPNLKSEDLLLSESHADSEFYAAKLSDKRIRQTQIPILDNDKQLAGYLLVAVSLEGRLEVLDTLGKIILISYPLVLLVLFFVTRLIVSRSIRPINNIINTANAITRDNLVSRIPLPDNEDELYTLAQTINSLLDRIEQVIDRERLFSSYASHEFRTPLAIMKGTLEVLIRKPRTEEEYQSKIKSCVKEIDRLNSLVDQLLLLTRYENQKKTISIENTCLASSIDTIAERLQSSYANHKVRIINRITSDLDLKTDLYLFYTIINNILSNAIKYSYPEGIIEVSALEEKEYIKVNIKDSGQGIPENDLTKIFEDFYRSTQNADSEIKGFGLGLSIVKRFCQILDINIDIISKLNTGTIVTLQIPIRES